MCGIAGILTSSGGNRDELITTVAAMAASLRHRGPDASGTWVDPEAGVALGHRRLSVLDRSPAGGQPMASADERWLIAYNGEVYNHAELRAELEALGTRFRSRCDTEVVLESCAAWGIRPAIERLNGMFAFAIWDRRDRVLYLIRDRMGIKPLFWGQFGDLFVFGSELAALRAHPGWRAEIDRDALASYMRLNNVPAPYCIYRGVRKLEPGHLLTVRDGAAAAAEPYWDVREAALRGLAEPLETTDAEAVELVEALLRDSVGRRMAADVPLGAFLSGGIDSSTVVALMHAHSGAPVRTFSIGFDAGDYDEAPQARAVAAHLGTEHTELYADATHAEELIPRLARAHDEPFADSSQIPSYLVSRLAREHVTVALSGDGGDEVFAGYNRYRWAPAVWRVARHIPAQVRETAAALLTASSPQMWDRALRVLPARSRPPQAGAKVHKLASVLASPDPETIYRRLVSHWGAQESVVLGASELSPAPLGRDVLELAARMQLLDQLGYLPNDILAKLDRASMSASLEARVPLLDHRVVELAWRLPSKMKIRGGTTKWVLRQVLRNHVPDRLTQRPKSGFSVPLDAWLRGPLRGWAEGLLDADRIRDAGYLKFEAIETAWRDHVSRRSDNSYALWNVLMFQSWLEHESR